MLLCSKVMLTRSQCMSACTSDIDLPQPLPNQQLLSAHNVQLLISLLCQGLLLCPPGAEHCCTMQILKQCRCLKAADADLNPAYAKAAADA